MTSDVPIDLNSALARVVAIGVEALEALGVTAAGSPQFLQPMVTFPYFSARVVAHDLTVDENAAEEMLLHEVQIGLRLIIGHLTEGYAGEPETQLYTYIPAVLTHLAERVWLRCDAYPNSLPNLIRADVTSAAGLRVFEHVGIRAQQVGTEFTIRCLFVQRITQAFS